MGGKHWSVGGFTLIEVMVVVVILSILAAILVPKVMDRPDAARVTKVHNDLRAIESALNLYRLDNFNYPSTDQGLQALVEKPVGEPEARNWKAGGYLAKPKMPEDPWGNEYQYLSPGVRNRDFDLYSFGKDGVEGGEGYDADITNWD